MVCSSFVDSVSQRETENAGGVLGRSKQARNTARADAKHTHTYTHSLPCSNWAALRRHTHMHILQRRGLDEYRAKRREGEGRNGKKGGVGTIR